MTICSRRNHSRDVAANAPAVSPWEDELTAVMAAAEAAFERVYGAAPTATS